MEQVENTPMSAETNLPTEQSPEVQATQVAQDETPTAETFTLQPDAEPIEPFDLNPVPVTAETTAAPEASGSVDESQAQVQELTQRLEALKAQLQEKSNQLDERNTLYMRIAADFENFRKRTDREKEELEQKIKCSTISELLPVVDNFERARSQIKPQSDAEMNIHKSYQGLYKDLVDRLKRIGVSPMRAEGQEFDPNLHEAVMRQPSREHPEGTVMEELQRGYLMGDRVLRHALVKVAAAPDDSEPTAPAETAESSNS